jgi:hypothetical protein
MHRLEENLNKHLIRLAGQCIAGIAEHAPNTTASFGDCYATYDVVHTLVSMGGSIFVFVDMQHLAYRREREL